jgi:phenylalanyl-tRNA synthetase alpha subunit
MSSPIERLRAQFDEQLAVARTDQDLKALRDQYLGRKGGAVAGLMKEVASAPPDQRPVLGRQANELKQHSRPRVPRSVRSMSRFQAARRLSAGVIR